MRPEWQAALDEEIDRSSAAELAAAAQQLTSFYRESRTGDVPRLSNAAQRAAYLAVRLPATYAAVVSAVEHMQECAPNFAPASLLDLGAGPGTASCAALESFPSLAKLTLVERDQQFATTARTLLPDADVSVGDFTSVDLPCADFVVCAYAINEVASASRLSMIQRACDSAIHAVLFVEPGSPPGFANILAARQHLIACGWHIAAPCPGHMPCSLAEVNDWCHFSARVQRSALHRRLKSAELSYEDEKFSYVAALRTPATGAQSRIVRRPEKLSGHVKLALCTPVGLQRETVTKKSEAYKRARKSDWGDPFPII